MEPTAATAARDAEVFGARLQATQDALEAFTDQELAVIGRFLERTRAITAAHANALAASTQEPARGRDDA